MVIHHETLVIISSVALVVVRGYSQERTRNIETTSYSTCLPNCQCEVPKISAQSVVDPQPLSSNL